MSEKHGFTLSEVLITLLIVGVIMAMSVPVVVSVKGSYTTSTYYVYKNLEAAVTKIIAGSPHPYSEFNCSEEDSTPDDQHCVTTGFNISDIRVIGEDGKTTSLQEEVIPADGIERTRNILFNCDTGAPSSKNLNLIRGVYINPNVEYAPFDNEGKRIKTSCKNMQNESNRQSDMFCRALASLSNAGKRSNSEQNSVFCYVNPSNSSETDLKDVVIDPQTLEPRISQDDIDLVYETLKLRPSQKEFVCEKIAGTNIYHSDASKKCAFPNFVAGNGYMYFVSKWQKMDYGDEYGYRLVAVDLNGKRAPNITDRIDNKKLPDIVTFIVWDTGTVYPLGVAADDLFVKDSNDQYKYRNRYMPSEAKGYTYEENPSLSAEQKKEMVPHECAYGPGESTQPWAGKKAPAGCSYMRKNIENSVDDEKTINGLYKMTFREAYCTVNYIRETENNSITIHPGSFDYCHNVKFNNDYLALFAHPDKDKPICPRVGGLGGEGYFDYCKVEPIKPVFKFDLDN